MTVTPSEYHRSFPPEPHETPEVEVAIKTVEGREGDLLRIKQAEAIAAILRWVIDEKDRKERGDYEDKRGAADDGAA